MGIKHRVCCVYVLGPGQSQGVYTTGILGLPSPQANVTTVEKFVWLIPLLLLTLLLLLTVLLLTVLLQTIWC